MNTARSGESAAQDKLPDRVRDGGDLDALQLTPLVSTLVTQRVVLLSSVAGTPWRMTIDVPGTGPAVAHSYDVRGRLTAT